MIPLSELAKGQLGTITQIEDSHASIQLMEMGFVSGKSVSVLHVAPLGDPIAVQIAGYLLSIRKQDAAKIWVEVK